MKLHVDKEAGALNLRLDDSPVIESEEVSPQVVLDFNEQNLVAGMPKMRTHNKTLPQRQVAATDREITQPVHRRACALYGLTEEEIRIVEGE